MAVGEIYVGRIQYEFFGEELENRFYVRHLAGTGDAASLANALEITFLPTYKSVQNVNVDHTRIVVINTDNPTDFTTELTGGSGVVPGDGMPPFTSYGFTFFSSDRRIRSGGCRIGVPSEADISNGIVDAGALGALVVLAGLFNSPFTDLGLANTYEIQLHTNGNLETLGLPLTVPLRNVLYRRVTTQSSRKFQA